MVTEFGHLKDIIAGNDSAYINCDCMEGMKQFPDQYFDLAIVDPPYGDGGGEWSKKERFGGRFDQYRHDPVGGGTPGRMTREREIPHQYTDRKRTAGNQTEHGVMRTGGTWAAKFSKKS